MAPNRSQRAKIAQETLSILKNGFYTNTNGENVSIQEDLASSVSNSRVFSSSELNSLRSENPKDRIVKDATIEVTDERSIEAVNRLAGEHIRKHLACLNFASAKNVCGGMLSGSLAQEESLGLCSGLHSSLSQFIDGYYEINRKNPNEGLYSDNLMWSPGVPVIREDKNLTLLHKPVSCSFISCPAPNKGRYLRSKDAQDQTVNEIMKRRIENVLKVALHYEVDVLILGAWGCGVFRNDPNDVARCFTDQLKLFKGKFSKIVFAVGKEDRMMPIFQRWLN